MANCLPQNIDDWMEDDLDDGSFRTKERLFGDVLLVCLCGVLGKKGILGCLKKSLFLLILFGLLFSIQLLGCTIRPNSFVTTFL